MNQIDWLLHAKQALKLVEDHEIHKRPGHAVLALYEALGHLDRGAEILKRAHAAQVAERVYGDAYAQVERESVLG